MNPDEHLRSLQDPDRWSGVRLPRAQRSRGVVSSRVASYAAAAVALGIAAATVAGIGIAFASVPHGEPVAGGSPTQSPTVDGASDASGIPACGAVVHGRFGDSTVTGDARVTALLLDNAGRTCRLPVASFSLDGVPAGPVDAGSGAVSLPQGTSELAMLTSSSCGPPVRGGPAGSLAPLTLRRGDVVVVMGEIVGHGCTAPTIGQVDGGRAQPIGQLAASAALATTEAALEARYAAASASASASAAATPSTSTPSATPSSTAGGPSAPTTSPVAPAACASAQLSFSQGDFGGGVGVWLESLAVQNDGAPCTVTAGQFTIGSFTLGEANRYGGSSILLGRGRTTLAIAAAHSCVDQVHANIPDQHDRVPIVLHAAGSTREIGDYPKPVCFAPYFF